MFCKIMVPLDGSTLAEASLCPAKFMARAFNAEVKLISVEEMPAHLSDLEWRLPQQAILDQAKSQSEAYLQARAHELRSEGCTVTFEVLPLGSAAQRILEEVEANKHDLLILTSHGRTGLTRFMMGSVAERLARYARCPVMIVGRNSEVVSKSRMEHAASDKGH